MSFPPLIPLGWQGLRIRFAKLPSYAISVSLTIGIHKNNVETFRVTEKQYYKIILFKKVLLNEIDIFREVTDKYHKVFPGKKIATKCWPSIIINPLSANLTKWPNTLKQFIGKLPRNCLSVFHHFVKLALKGLRNPNKLFSRYYAHIILLIWLKNWSCV